MTLGNSGIDTGNDAVGNMRPAASRQLMNLWVDICYVALLLAVAVGFKPFNEESIQQYAMASQGSQLEAAVYLICGATLVLNGFAGAQRQRYLSCIIFLLPLFLYCLLSIKWSATPTVALSRFIQFLIVFLSVMSFVVSSGARKFIMLTIYTLIPVVLIDVISVFLVRGAVHIQDFYGEAIAGAWKGVHMHKNYAGAVTSILAILLVLNLRKENRLIYLAALAIALLFLIGTRSKTSMLVAVICLIASYLYFLLIRKFSLDLIIVTIVTVVTAIVGLLVTNSSELAIFLSDGQNLTGRVELWQSMAKYIGEHPWNGSGFGSFWRVGVDSPILDLTYGWGARTGQAHNGYIDTIAVLGFPGAAVVFFYFLLFPVYITIRSRRNIDFYAKIAIVIFIFCIVYNISETTFLVGNNIVNFMLCFSISCLLSNLVFPVASQPRAAS